MWKPHLHTQLSVDLLCWTLWALTNFQPIPFTFTANLAEIWWMRYIYIYIHIMLLSIWISKNQHKGVNVLTFQFVPWYRVVLTKYVPWYCVVQYAYYVTEYAIRNLVAISKNNLALVTKKNRRGRRQTYKWADNKHLINCRKYRRYNKCMQNEDDGTH